MAPSTLRRAIGAVKDQTSIGIVKVASNMAPELKVAVVKATSHDDDLASEKYIREILHFTSYSGGYVTACVSAISKRLGKTRDWIVALKCLMLIHRLLNDGDPSFQQEIMYATRRGTRLLNLSDFRDEAHSSSWDQSGFVRTYALYLDQRLEVMVYERKQSGNGGEIDRKSSSRDDDRYNYNYRSQPGSNRGYGHRYDEGSYEIRRSRSSGDVMQEKKDAVTVTVTVTPLREMQPERILGKMNHLHRLLDRFLCCRPSGLAKNERMILVAVYTLLKESFKIYADICEVLAVLLDKFFDMESQDCEKTFNAYSSSAKQIDELVGFYNWCKDIGVAGSSEYPEVQKISSKLLETLEEFVRDREKATKSPERKEMTPPPEEELLPDMNEIKALPAPESYIAPPVVDSPKARVEEKAPDLLDLRDEEVLTGDDQGNKFALALFAGESSWEPFSKEEETMTSAWQNPAAEAGKADWEVALVESASNLSKQKAEMGGGMDPLLLNGMYDQGVVRRHVDTVKLGGGSASSVAFPGKAPVLALPAPEGAVAAVGGDPFAASLSVPPPAYVQMADMEKKQGLLVQEQMVWRQYTGDGMRGETSLAKISAGGYYAAAPGMAPVNGVGVQPYGYYRTPY